MSRIKAGLFIFKRFVSENQWKNPDQIPIGQLRFGYVQLEFYL